MANPLVSQIQSIGDFSLVWTHPLLNGGNGVGLVGFKVQGDILDTDQEMDNSRVVVLLGGVAITLTNTVRAGTLRLTAVRTTGQIPTGDVVACCKFLQQNGDNVGGQLRAAWTQNGTLQSVTFLGVTVKRCKPLRIAGNDVPDYDVQLAYQDWQ